MSGKPREPRLFPIAPPPVPPRSWGRRERALWRRIVESFPANHFRQSDEADLKAFVLASIELDELELVIANEGRVLVDSKTGRRYPHPACVLRDRAWTRLAGAGTKLRLHLSARMKSEDANTASKIPAASNPRPWESAAYFEDGKTPKKSNGKAADVRGKYGF